ncbi:RabGAP/TBC [Gonapodya prolifera JEL478]|uniref:RabGAP/TBC n=1 Tax=Gonapodya prolifera (strain JEL478) TaxID=1344416 RepID=A0A139AT86_GONPJ|nr:RabGAP/TBC [Gonapodya prolifera JEL478]|eukprot:KXS19950.1 RabGAP/TBC [Gonapodya prolifera JEL478]
MARKVEPQQRLREFEHIVFTGRTGDGGREIDFETFRRQCFAGIPDTPASVRDACWKILLNYTPWADRASWPSSLTTLRSTYYSYVRDLSDPPLSPPDSPTTTTLEDPNAALLQQIYSDVRRTLPDMAFFQLPVPAQWGSRSPLFPVPPTNSDATVSPSSSTTSLPTLTPPTDTRASYPDIPNPFLLYARIAHLYAAEVPPVDLPGTPLHSTSSSSSPPTTESATTTAPHTHADSLLRILYLFARLNPGVGYVQGMNEVLAPLYYVSAHGADAGAFCGYYCIMFT